MGALLHTFAGGPVLTAVLGGLLVFAGVTGLTGLVDRVQFSGLDGLGRRSRLRFLGGLVGNQDGIRSAAMLGFDVPKQAIKATATAVALMVDGARMPIYLATQGRDILAVWPFVAVGTAGVPAGTLVGERVLRRVPESLFRRVVSTIILALGAVRLIGVARQLLT